MFSSFIDIEVKCGYLGPRNGLYTRIREMLEINEIILGQDMDLAEFFSLDRAGALSYDYLFVDIDGLGGITRIVDSLAALRLEYPSVPVIMISSDFEMDDFDSTRRALGDVSLRSPVLFASLEVALFEALENNSKWRESVVYYRQDTAA